MGFSKKTRTRSGSGTGFIKPRPGQTRTRPVSNIIKKKKILGINTTLSLQKIISLTLISHLSAASLSFTLSHPSLYLTLSLSHLLSPVPPPPHRSNRSLPPSPSYSLIHLAAEIASSSLTTPLTPQSRRRRRSFLPPLSPRLDWKKKGFLLVFRGSVFGVLEELK